MPKHSEQLHELARRAGKSPMRFVADAVNEHGSGRRAAAAIGVPWRTFYSWVQRYRIYLATRAIVPGEEGYRDPLLEGERVA